MDFLNDLSNIVMIFSGACAVASPFVYRVWKSKKLIAFKNLTKLFNITDRALCTIKNISAKYTDVSEKEKAKNPELYSDMQTVKKNIDNVLECLADLLAVIPALKDKVKYLRDIIK